METLTRLIRAFAFGLIAMIGLFMALVFTFSTIIAVAVLYVVARFRGRKFSVQEYWTTRRTQRKPVFPSGVRSGTRSRDGVTDVEARDIP